MENSNSNSPKREQPERSANDFLADSLDEQTRLWNEEHPGQPWPNDPNHPLIKAFRAWAEQHAQETLDAFRRNSLADKLTS
jgi:hypothetical protein